MKKSVAVLGLGKFGSSIARSLAKGGAEVLAVDKDEDLVRDIADKVTCAVCVDISDKEMMNNIGLEGMDAVVIATAEHLDSSVMALMIEQGVHTNIDTSGAVFTKEEPFFGKLQELLKYTDMLMLDIKHIDDEQHKILTGQSNKNILEFARYLSDIKKPIWIRHVLVPERSDKDEYLERLHDFIETLDNVERVEVLPYHTLGAYKWKELGYDYKLEGIDPPTPERIENANRILETAKYLK